MSEINFSKSAPINRCFTFLSLLLSVLLISTCSSELTPESVKKWIADDDIGRITDQYEELTAKEVSLTKSQPGKKGVIQKEKAIIIEAVFETKYRKGMDYFLSVFWDSPHGYYGHHILQQCFKYNVPVRLSDIMMLYISASQPINKSSLDPQPLLELLNDSKTEELRQSFMLFIDILVDTTGSKNIRDFTKLGQANWLRSYWQSTTKGYDYLFPVLENVTNIGYNEIKPLVQHLAQSEEYSKAFDLIRKAQNPPEGNEHVFAKTDTLFDELEKYKELIDKLNKEELETKTEIPSLEKSIKKQKEILQELEEEECDKVYGTVHKLLDNNGFGGTPRYIVTINYENAILNTFSTFSRAGWFELPAKLLTKKIALTDGDGFTKYWPHYLQIEDCEWDRMQRFRTSIEQDESNLSYNKKRLVEILAEVEKYSHDMKGIFEEILGISDLLFSVDGGPSLGAQQDS